MPGPGWALVRPQRPEKLLPSGGRAVTPSPPVSLLPTRMPAGSRRRYQDGQYRLYSGYEALAYGPYRARGRRSRCTGVQIMSDVACFCGCCYSFEGDGGACPRCGEYAAVRSGPARASTGRSQPEPVPADSDRLPAGAAARG